MGRTKMWRTVPDRYYFQITDESGRGRSTIRGRLVCRSQLLGEPVAMIVGQKDGALHIVQESQITGIRAVEQDLDYATNRKGPRYEFHGDGLRIKQ